MHLVIGDGILGSEIMKKIPAIGTSRKGNGFRFELGDDPEILPNTEVAYLCAGTKGYRECEGNTKAFRADVDGNLRLIRFFLKRKTFPVFISTDGVEWGG